MIITVISCDIILHKVFQVWFLTSVLMFPNGPIGFIRIKPPVLYSLNQCSKWCSSNRPRWEKEILFHFQSISLFYLEGKVKEWWHEEVLRICKGQTWCAEDSMEVSFGCVHHDAPRLSSRYCWACSAGGRACFLAAAAAAAWAAAAVECCPFICWRADLWCWCCPEAPPCPWCA